MGNLRAIGQVSITVHDLDRAVMFYRDVLEFQYVWKTTNMAFFTCGDVRLMLSVPGKSEFDHPSSVIYYSVDVIEQAYHELRAKGVEFRDVPHEVGKLGDKAVFQAIFDDSEGNMLAIQSEVVL